MKNNVFAQKTELLQKVIQRYGVKQQHNIAVEEMAELTKAICKMNRLSDESDPAKIADATRNLHEEIADVELMLEQLKMMHSCHADVLSVKEDKLMRLKYNLGL